MFTALRLAYLTLACGFSADRALEVAKLAALKAGAIIKDALASREERGVQITVKSGIDLVTETDPKCEEVVLEALRAAFPDHGFVGEESTFAAEGSGAGAQVGNARPSPASPAPSPPPFIKWAVSCLEQSVSKRPTWFVDPLDGTTNFVHAYPFVAVSIGLTIDGEPVVGVVYNPVMNELYTAAKGMVSLRELPRENRVIHRTRGDRPCRVRS